jgi:hypothetical protein
MSLVLIPSSCSSGSLRFQRMQCIYIPYHSFSLLYLCAQQNSPSRPTYVVSRARRVFFYCRAVRTRSTDAILTHGIVASERCCCRTDQGHGRQRQLINNTKRPSQSRDCAPRLLTAGVLNILARTQSAPRGTTDVHLPRLRKKNSRTSHLISGRSIPSSSHNKNSLSRAFPQGTGLERAAAEFACLPAKIAAVVSLPDVARPYAVTPG